MKSSHAFILDIRSTAQNPRRARATTLFRVLGENLPVPTRLYSEVVYGPSVHSTLYLDRWASMAVPLSSSTCWFKNLVCGTNPPAAI